MTLEIRKQLGLTQAEFARLVGVSQQRVSDWETGKRGMNARTWIRIMDAAKAYERRDNK